MQVGNTVLDVVLKEICVETGNKVALAYSKDNTNGQLAGKITFYELSGPNWIESGPVLYGNPGEEVGVSFKLSDNGNILGIRTVNTGEIRVYQNINHSWVQMGLSFQGQSPTDTTGAFSISADGMRIATTIKNHVNPGVNGIVQVYDWDGTAWNQIGSDIKATSAIASYIGEAMDISGTGQLLAVSGKVPSAIDGELFFFRWDNNISDWAANGSIAGVPNGEFFARGLQVSYDGSVVAYSIQGDGGPPLDPTGSLRVIKQDFPGAPWYQLGNTIWGDSGYGYGENIDLSDNGKRVVWEGDGGIGQPVNSGCVRVYEFDGTNWGLIFEKYGEADETFGSYGVSLNGDGSVVSTLTNTPSTLSSFKSFSIGIANGSFYYDLNQNCVKDGSETGIPNHLGIIQPGNHCVQTDSFGNWSIKDLPDGNYTITIDTSRSWSTTCPVSQAFTIFAAGPSTTVVPLGISSKANSTDGDISIIMPIIRPCTNQNIYVTVCNSLAATNSIDTGMVLIQIDPILTVVGMSLPYTSVGNNQFLVNLDTIAPGACQPFTVSVDVSCTAVIGQAVCIESGLNSNYCNDEPYFKQILPTTTLVSECLTAYDGSFLEVAGYCQNDSIYFEITNTAPFGNDMDCFRPVIVLKDGVWVHADSVQLNAQQSYTLAFEGNGASWHLATYQHPLNPIISYPSVTIENCGGTTLPSQIATFGLDDQSLCTDIFCDVVTGPFDPNDKRGFPIGFSSNNYVFPNGQMQYVVRFQNVGTDTAENVLIRDTLDLDLDIFSLRPGPGSHYFEYQIVGIQVIEVIFPNLRLPDSMTNVDESMGFFSFTISQKPDLPPGTIINNSTEIYFDFNAPIKTNETEHIVYYLLESQDVIHSCGPYTWIDGNTYNFSTDSASMLFQNTLGLDSIVHLDLTIHNNISSIDFVEACGDFIWIDGNTYTINNNTATYTYPGGSYHGCDSTVYLALTTNNAASGIEIVNSCLSYTWIDGVTYYSSTNSWYTYEGASYSGCDSTIQLNLTIEAVNTSVTHGGGTLTADVSGASYQWLDCDNNYAPISGETGQSFTPNMNGNYAVQITEYNCTDMSECFNVTGTNTTNKPVFEEMTIFPNPTTGKVNIRLQSTSEWVQIEVMNVLGQRISQHIEEQTEFISLDIDGPDGVYLIKVKTESGASKWTKVNKTR